MKRLWLCLGAIVLAGGLALVAPRPALAQEPDCDPGSNVPNAPVPGATATAVPPNPCPDTPGSTTPGGGGSVIRQILQIVFPWETMTEAVTKMTQKILEDQIKGARIALGNAVESAISNLLRKSDWFERLALPGWKITLAIALGLLPATLALTALLAMRNGVTSVLGYADMKDALLSWLICAGLAGASYYLIGLGHRLSLEMSGKLLTVAGPFSGADVANIFLNVSLLTAAAAGIAAMASVPLGLIGIFILALAGIFGLTFLAAMILALSAYSALLVVLTILAPLAIVLSSLPPFRWLGLLWLKALTITLLVGPANGMLIGIAVRLFKDFNVVSSAGPNWVGAMLAAVGALSLMLTLDFKLGEFVFGAIGEVWSKAHSSTMGIVGAIGTVAGLAVGAAVAGPAGAALGASIGGSASGGGTGSGPSRSSGDGGISADGPASDTSRARGPTATASAGGNHPGDDLASSQLRERTSRLTASLGRALSMGSGQNSTLKGLGLGLMVGGEAGAAQAGVQSDGIRSSSLQSQQVAQEQRYQSGRQDAMHAQFSRVFDAVDRGTYATAYPRGFGDPSFDTTDLYASLIRHHAPGVSPAQARLVSASLNQAMMSKPEIRMNHDGNLQAAREGLFDAISSASPTNAVAFSTAIESWARQSNVSITLPESIHADIQQMFG